MLIFQITISNIPKILVQELIELERSSLWQIKDCVTAHVRAGVRAGVRALVRACVRARMRAIFFFYKNISGLARPQGRQKKKINPSKIPPKAIKPKAEPGHYIGVNVWIFWQFSHARIKGFPNSDWHLTLSTYSTHILPKLWKFEEIWPSSSKDMSIWILEYWGPYTTMTMTMMTTSFANIITSKSQLLVMLLT